MENIFFQQWLWVLTWKWWICPLSGLVWLCDVWMRWSLNKTQDGAWKEHYCRGQTCHRFADSRCLDSSSSGCKYSLFLVCVWQSVSWLCVWRRWWWGWILPEYEVSFSSTLNWWSVAGQLRGKLKINHCYLPSDLTILSFKAQLTTKISQERCGKSSFFLVHFKHLVYLKNNIP